MDSEINYKCRTCLSGSNTYHQLHDYVGEYEIIEMLDGIVPQIDVKTSSKFSTLMCKSCVDKLLISYKFQQLCLESNNRLHDLLNTALFDTEQEKLLTPLTDESILQIKHQTEEDVSDFETRSNEPEREMQSDNDNNRTPDEDGELESDSSVMETPDEEKNRRKTQKKLKKDSAAYLHQREKANARKRKFLDKMTEEQKEIKRAKDREYYKNKKAENKVKRITDMTESEKRNQRKNWKKASKKYGEKKKGSANLGRNTPPQSDHLAAVPPEKSNEQLSILKERLAKEIPLKNENFEKIKQHSPVQGTVCTICDKDFRYNSKLKEHMRKHSGESPYLCTQCGKTFRRARGLKYHISVHSGEKPFDCSQCGKTFRDISYFREHMARHSGMRKHQCPDCPSRFYRRADLRRHCRSEKVHLNIANFSNLNKLQNDCNDLFKPQTSSDVYRVNDKKEGDECAERFGPDMENIEEIESTDSLQEKRNETIERSTKNYAKEKIEVSSQILDESMDDMDDDAEWIGNNHEDSDDNSEKKFGSQETKLREKIDGHYPCETCGKVFYKVFLLKRHSSVHSLAKPHKCEICKYRFASTKTLKAHLSKHRNGTVRNFKYLTHRKDKIKPVCSVCKKEFANNYNLKEHMRLHSGEKPFQCAQCGKTFRYSSALKEHMRTHSGENPYHCSHCGKTFRYSSSFNRHKDKHMGLKKYQCPECPSRFKSASELASHRAKLHLNVANLKNNFSRECEICNTNLTSEKSFETHMLMHRNDEAGVKKIVPQHDSIGENDCSDIFEIQEFLEVPKVNVKEEAEECFEQKALLSAHYKLHKEADLFKITSCKNFEAEMQDNEVVNQTDDFQEKTNKSMERVANVVVKEEIDDTSQIFEVTMDAGAEWITNDYGNSHSFREPVDDFNNDKKWINNEYEDIGGKQEKKLFPKLEAEETKNIDFVDTSRDDIEMPESSNKIKGSYPCETCGKVFCYLYLLKRHGSVHSLTKPLECEFCKYRFDTANMLHTHLLQHKKKRRCSNSQSRPVFECPDCPRHFEKQASLTLHRLTHTRNTSCMVCQRNFISLETLAEHISSTHPEVEKYKCDQCDKIFALHAELLAHLTHHKDNKNVVCPICEREFSHSYKLKAHMRSHSGETPYVCTQCDKTFRSSNSLRQHMERHTCLKKYQCPQCPSRFKCRSDLTNHRRKIHLRIAYNNELRTCNQCGKSFSNASNLREHMKRHTGLKIYQCPTCPKHCNCKSDLINHGRVKKFHLENANIESDNEEENVESNHSKNLLTFQCPDCPQRFEKKTSLSVHYKIHAQKLECNKFEPEMEDTRKVNSLDKLQENTCKSTENKPTVTVKEEIEEYEEPTNQFDGTEWFNNDYKQLDDNSENKLLPKLEAEET